MIALLLSLTLLGGPLAPLPVQGLPLTIAVDTAEGYRSAVQVGAIMDDPALEEAVRSGVPLRMKLRTELWRDGFFHSLIGDREMTVVVHFQPLERRFVVHTRHPNRMEVRGFDDFSGVRNSLEQRYTPNLRPHRRGRYYYSAVLELETLTLSDLAELERWLKGELQPAVSGDRSVPSAVGQGVKRLLVRVLRLPARRYEARSAWFRVGG